MSDIIIKEVENAYKILQNGGVIVYPTDTVWGIGCDATNEEAIKKLYKIKQRNSSNPMLCLISRPSMLKKYLIPYLEQLSRTKIGANTLHKDDISLFLKRTGFTDGGANIS